MERFYTAHNRFDAYLVLHRLQQAGIAAHVFNEHTSSIVGEVPPDVAQPQVWLEDGCDRPAAPARRRIRQVSSCAGIAGRTCSRAWSKR